MRPSAAQPSLLPLHLFTLAALLTTLATLLLTGCGAGPRLIPSASPGLALQGRVHGGQQAIAGSHVYLLAAGTSAFGGTSVSLLYSGDGTDTVGVYVLSAADGSFSITGDYICTPGQQVYALAEGGDAGGGTNAVIGLMAVVGACPGTGTFYGTVPFIEINEVSTVAAAYALSGFATDSTDISDDESFPLNSTAASAQTGMANAFANAANLADLGSGTALSVTPNNNGFAPQPTINTLANILAACVNTNGALSTTDSNDIVTELPCGILIAATSSLGLPVPTDTAGAAINIAHSPASNVAALYALPSSSPPFEPSLNNQPSDFSVAVIFLAGYQTPGLSGIAIDPSGNAWVTDIVANRVIELSPQGTVLSGASGFTDPSLSGPGPVAIDTSGGVWVLNTTSVPNSITGFSNAGTLTTSTPASGLALSLAIDATGNIWVPNDQGANANKLDEFSSAGAYTTTLTGGGMNVPAAIAMDISGNLWLANAGASDVSQFSTSGAPIATYSGDSMAHPRSIAIDAYGFIWVQNGDASISGISATGVPLYPAPFLTGMANFQPVNGSLQIDGKNHLWSLAEYADSSLNPPVNPAFYLFGVDESGNSLTPPGGFEIGTPFCRGLAIDSSGDLWVTASQFIGEIIGRVAPVITPLAAAVTAGRVASLP